MVKNKIKSGPNGEFQMEAGEGDDKKALLADLDLHPHLNAAASIRPFMITDSALKHQEVSIVDTFCALRRQSEKVNSGDLQRVEDMLLCQAHTLDLVFSNLLIRGQKNIGHNLDAVDRYLKLAMKAQNQCRMTLETLANVKNPTPYIQNNRAQYQQVNNSPAASHAENKIQQNELLEQDDESHWMDARTATETSRDDRQLEAMGAKYRPKVIGGQECQQAEQP